MTEAQIDKLDALTDLILDILADEPTNEQIEPWATPIHSMKYMWKFTT